MPGFCIDTVSGHFSGPRFLEFVVHVSFFLTYVLERVNRKRARVRAREITALPLGRKTLVVGKSPLPSMADNLGPTIGQPLWTHQDKRLNGAILTAI